MLRLQCRVKRSNFNVNEIKSLILLNFAVLFKNKREETKQYFDKKLNYLPLKILFKKFKRVVRLDYILNKFTQR